jgi:hypothetical protein
MGSTDKSTEETRVDTAKTQITFTEWNLRQAVRRVRVIGTGGEL